MAQVAEHPILKVEDYNSNLVIFSKNYFLLNSMFKENMFEATGPFRISNILSIAFLKMARILHRFLVGGQCDQIICLIFGHLQQRHSKSPR